MEDPLATDKAVLVVDDHQPVRTLLITLLRNAGLRVLEADSGQAALQLLKESGGDIGCVLQDLSMPNMSGKQVISAMLEIDPNLPIIAMSIYDEANARSTLKNLNIAGYAQKPFASEKLVADIRALLGAPDSTDN